MILDYVRRCERSMLFSTIITLILGLVLVFEPGGSIRVITSLIAVMFIFIGAIQLIDYFRQSKEEKIMSLSLILGIILCGIGVFLFINLNALVNFITTVIGVMILVKSLFKIQFAFNIRGISDKWFYNLIVGGVGITLGVILLLNPFSSAELFLRIVGGILSFSSILEIVETFVVMKTLDDAKNLPFSEKNKK